MPQDVELHPTGMVKYQECGKRFDLETISRVVPQWRVPQALNGTAIHRTIAWFHLGNWDATEDEVRHKYAESFAKAIEDPYYVEERGVPVKWPDGSDPQFAAAEFAADALEMIEGYRKDPRNRAAKVVAVEVEWSMGWDGFNWAGTIDQIRVEKDRLVVVDLKSGQNRPPAAFLALWPQGLTYARAVHGDGAEHAHVSPRKTFAALPDLPVEKMVWVHLRDYVPYKRKTTRQGRVYLAGDLRGQAYYDAPVTPAALQAHAKEMSAFADAVRAGRFDRRPSIQNCARCSVRNVCLATFGEYESGALSSLLSQEEVEDNE